MLSKDDLGRLLEYTVWANHRIMRPVATLTVDEFKRDLGSSYGGLRGTLAHMMGAEWLWLERWKGVSPPALPDESEFPTIVALRDRWTLVEEHRAAWFAGLKESAVAETIRYQSTEGKAFEAPLWQLVQHVVNHATYHRGQITTLLRLLKAKTVGTDLVAWDRERAARKE